MVKKKCAGLLTSIDVSLKNHLAVKHTMIISNSDKLAFAVTTEIKANRIFGQALIVPPTKSIEKRKTCRIIYRNIILMTNTFSTCSTIPMPRITALRNISAGIHQACCQRDGCVTRFALTLAIQTAE